MKTLVSLLKEGLDRVGGSQTSLGRALGLSRVRITRLLSEGERGYPLGAQACFKLAELVNEPRTTILRLAGKGWLADELEGIEKTSVKERLTVEQRSLIGDYETVKQRVPETAKRVRQLLETMANDARGRPVIPARRTARR